MTAVPADQASALDTSGKTSRLPVKVRASKLSSVDREFLPAALEILETPASPVSMALILIICAFVVIALTWSYMGRLDIIAVAQGKFQPTGRVKTVQALETGRVLVNHVQNGMHVKKGDILLEFDPRDAIADEASSASEFISAQAETIRRKAAIEVVRRGMTSAPPQIVWPSAIPLAVQANETQVLQSDIAQLGAQTASLKAQADQKRAEKNRLRGMIEAENNLVDTLQQRVGMRTELIKQGAGSKGNYLDSLEALQREKTELVRDVGQIAEIDANLGVIDQDIQKSLDTFVAENAQKHSEAQRQVDVLSKKLVRAQIRTELMTIRSPLDGVIQASTVTTVGQVVSPSEELMRIVPDGVRLEIECYLPNKDIGFVHEGEPAVIKVEAFPFTRYGSIDATVVRVAHDAIPEPDAQQEEQDPSRGTRNELRAGAQRVQNLVFPITLQPKKSTINVDGVAVSLQAGMAATVEMRTGSRRIIDYLFSPLMQVKSEALTER